MAFLSCSISKVPGGSCSSVETLRTVKSTDHPPLVQVKSATSPTIYTRAIGLVSARKGKTQVLVPTSQHTGENVPESADTICYEFRLLNASLFKHALHNCHLTFRSSSEHTAKPIADYSTVIPVTSITARARSESLSIPSSKTNVHRCNQQHDRRRYQGSD